MSLERDKLPEPLAYYTENIDRITGHGKWRTAGCVFHGGSDSMRINTTSGAFVCMACGEKGGDVLAYHMKVTGMGFVEACKALGAWKENGMPTDHLKPKALPASDAMKVAAFEVNFVAITLTSQRNGTKLSDRDLFRLRTAAARLNRLAEDYQ